MYAAVRLVAVGRRRREWARPTTYRVSLSGGF